MNSLEISRRFYDKLGADGLKDRTTPEWDRASVEGVLQYLDGRNEILDLGCGYGRVALPLAKLGFRVVGIDVSPVLIEDALRTAAENNIEAAFRVGSMTQLPFDNNSFDAVISLWSAFNELLTESEQASAIQEIKRVLRPNGISLIDSFAYLDATRDEIASGQRHGIDNRLSAGIYHEGLRNPDFYHDYKSIERLCKTANINNWDIKIVNCGSKQRQHFTFIKES